MLSATPRFSVSMDAELYRRLLTYATAAERSIAAQVRFLIKEQLALLAGNHPTHTLMQYKALQSMSNEIFALRRKVDELSE